MRIPSPPTIDINSDNLRPAQLLELFRALQRDDVQEFVRRANDKYYHWDKLRFQKLPKGTTSEQMWAAVKVSRRNQKQILPLSFTKNEKLSYVLTPRHLEWLHDIDKQAGGAIGIASETGLVDDDDRYLFNSLMEEAIASSQLEGASTTRKVAKEMLRANRKPRTKAEQMIMNNYRTILEVRELQKEKLTPELLCHLQEYLTDQTLDHPNQAGRFRNNDEIIQVVDHRTNEIIHIPPPASELKWRIQEVCDFANTVSDPFIHPVVKAAVLHFALGFIHPFVDGNGRTARALFYWYMLKRNYWLFEYVPISRMLLKSPVKYSQAYLRTETDVGDVTYFVRFHLQAIVDAIGSFHRYVLAELRETKEAAHVLDSFPGLNNRQRSLIQDALKHPNIRCTTRSHQGKFHVTYPTARADLLGLERAGLLQKVKRGRTSHYLPSDDLRQRLQLPKRIGKPEKEKVPPTIVVTKVIKEEPKPVPAPRNLFD
jgi:Fic family protein